MSYDDYTAVRYRYSVLAVSYITKIYKNFMDHLVPISDVNNY